MTSYEKGLWLIAMTLFINNNTNMKHIISAFIITLFLSGGTIAKDNTTDNNAYDFSFKNIDGSNSINLSDYKGKLVMIVNTASLCGFTKQYSELQELYHKYKDQGLVIIAVPSNDFGKQEPGSGEEIKTFCETNFGITFPITEKVHVQSKASHPFFVWTREKLGFLSGPKWNFYKYLIGKDGNLVGYFSSFTKPMSKKLTKIIEENL